MNEFGFTPETQRALNRLNKGFFKLIGLPFRQAEAETIIIQADSTNPTDYGRECLQVESMNAIMRSSLQETTG